MTKTAMMVSHDSLDAPLARTFGKAKWLLLWDGDGGAEFRRNEQLSGGSVAGAIAEHGGKVAAVVQLRRRTPT